MMTDVWHGGILSQTSGKSYPKLQTLLYPKKPAPPKSDSQIMSEFEAFASRWNSRGKPRERV